MGEPPQANMDFVDLLSAFVEHEVEFLIVGAFALAAHGLPRATGDIDILVRPTAGNAELVHRALIAFGAPVDAHGVTPGDFEREGTVYQLGLPPRRIDILTTITGVSFDAAREHAIEGRVGSCTARFIGLEALIRNKRASGRTKDIADAESLEARRPPG